MPDKPPPKPPPVPWHSDDQAGGGATLRQGQAATPLGAITSSDEEATLAHGSQPDTLTDDDGEATLASPGPVVPLGAGGGAEATLVGDGAASASSRQTGGDARARESTDGRARESTGTPVDGDLPGAPVHVEQPGRYLIKRQYGAGGQGVVWLAIDATVGREVALKALDPARVLAGGGSLAGVEQRFLREARITGQLEHPGIAPVHDLGRRLDGSVYYVQKLVRGRTLRDALRECKTPQDRLRLLPHFVDICQAMAYAHGRGVIHRDLKPENIMVGAFGETVVLDWGLAKVRGHQDREPAPGAPQTAGSSGGMPAQGHPGETPQLYAPFAASLASDANQDSDATRDGQIIGTPLYMSPEQAAGRLSEVDERSDVWALGAILYELLCGRAPFAGGRVDQVIRRARKGIAPPVLELSPEAPRELAAVATRAISKDREHRYPSARALAAEIEAFSLGGRVSAYDYSPWELVKKLVLKNRLASAAVGLLLLVLITSSILIARDHRRALSALSETLALHASSAELEQRWAQAAAWYAAARAQEERPEARFGESMAEALAPRPLLRLGPHDRPAQAVVFVGNGDTAASTASDGGLRLWDTASGKLRLRAQAHDGLTPALDAGGGMIATGGADGRLRLWDAAGNPLFELGDGAAAPVAPADAQEGDEARDAKARQEQQGTKPRRLKGGRRAKAEKPDGDSVDHEERADEGTEGLPTTGIAVVAFSPDASLLAAGRMETGIELWDLKRRLRVGLFGVGERTEAVAFAPDGKRLASGGFEGVLRVRDLEGREQWSAAAHLGRLRTLAFSPDGTLLVSGGQDYLAQVFRPGTDEPQLALEGHQRSVTGARFSPDGALLATTSRDGLVILWDAATARPVTRLDADERAGNGVAFSADGSRLAAAFQDQVVRVWAMPPERRIRGLAGHRDAVRAVAFAPGGGLLASAAQDGTVRLWSREGAREVRVFKSAADKGKVRAVAFSSDAGLLASGGDGESLQLWNPATGALLHAIPGSPEGTGALAFAPGAPLLAAGSRKGMLHLYQRSPSGDFAVKLQVQTNHPAIESLAFSTDGARLATSGSDGVVQVWDSAALAPVVALQAHTEAGRGVVFSPDGALLASGGSDRRLLLYETRGWTIVRELEGHKGRIHGLAFSPDGKRLASSCNDHALRIFDVASGQLLFTLARHEGAVMDLSWSSDGRTIATASADKTLELIGVERAGEVLPPDQALAQVLKTQWLRLVGQRVEPLLPAARR